MFLPGMKTLLNTLSLQVCQVDHAVRATTSVTCRWKKGGYLLGRAPTYASTGGANDLLGELTGKN